MRNSLTGYNFGIPMNKKIDELPMSEKDNSEYQSAEIFEEEESQQNINLSGLNDNSTNTKTQGYFSIKNFSKIFDRPCLISRYKFQEEEQKMKEQKEKILILNTKKHPKTVNGVKKAVKEKFSQSEIDKYFQSKNTNQFSPLQQQVMNTIKDLKVSQLKGWIDNSKSEVIYPPDHYQQKKARRMRLQQQKKINLNEVNGQQEQRQQLLNQDQYSNSYELSSQNIKNTAERGLQNQINISDFGSYIENINIGQFREQIKQQFENQSGQSRHLQQQQQNQNNILIESEQEQEQQQPPEKFNYNDGEAFNDKQVKPRNQKTGKNIQKSKHHGKDAREKWMKKNNVQNKIKKFTNRQQIDDCVTKHILKEKQQQQCIQQQKIQEKDSNRQTQKKKQQPRQQQFIFPSERQMRLSEKQNK